jgi:predicted transcriptional regulator
VNIMQLVLHNMGMRPPFDVSQLSDQKQHLLAALRDAGEPVSTPTLSLVIGRTNNSTALQLEGLQRLGLVEKIEVTRRTFSWKAL